VEREQSWTDKRKHYPNNQNHICEVVPLKAINQGDTIDNRQGEQTIRLHTQEHIDGEFLLPPVKVLFYSLFFFDVEFSLVGSQ